MADTTETRSTTAATNTPLVILDSQQNAARELARELDEMKRSGRKLDETVPGGRYGNAGGDGFHDAHGLPILEGKAARGAEPAPTDPADIQARLRELEEEKTRLAAQLTVAVSNAQADATTGGDADASRSSATTKRGRK